MTDPHDRPYTFGWHGEVTRRSSDATVAARTVQQAQAAHVWQPHNVACSCGATPHFSELANVWHSDHKARAIVAALAERDRAIAERAWDERDKAHPSYLGPRDGHYEDCMGWSDCHCATYPNPYRKADQ